MTGGAEVGTIRGIPAGTYEVFVRNSESNNDYKDTTTETLNVTGAMKFVAGQSLSDGTRFDYYDCGTEHYIRMDGTWYKVKNPKLPPVGEPV